MDLMSGILSQTIDNLDALRGGAESYYSTPHLPKISEHICIHDRPGCNEQLDVISYRIKVERG
jgi:hypothetical protein